MLKGFCFYIWIIGATASIFAGDLKLTLRPSDSKDLLISLKNVSSVDQRFFDSFSNVSFPGFFSCQFAKKDTTRKIIWQSQKLSLNQMDAVTYKIPVNLSLIHPKDKIEVVITRSVLRGRIGNVLGQNRDRNLIRFILSVAQDESLASRIEAKSAYLSLSDYQN